MILARTLLCAMLASGIAAAADPPQLPTAMSSAIARLVNPRQQSAPAKPYFLSDATKVPIVELPSGQVRLGFQPCSIPLADSKVPDNPKFFIRQAPLPKDSPDGMPVLQAPVCPIGEAR